ncbi:hypothetical protein IIV31_063L [Armadillidium vulgare iridescent virus]|uniref:Uncharacterized protein n=1 Tax=Armadillidium vulgare iridescent virus TaxID=72201 RepID=A0A068QL37_9VIRU|nr:hypothetical protein IIV31_063L [Armadillidium vulgare iridescent virus]CCV02435.1 hypothetical protein IIV31_063L [Armadillidium vulgare iridescent virus]
MFLCLSDQKYEFCKQCIFSKPEESCDNCRDYGSDFQKFCQETRPIFVFGVYLWVILGLKERFL